MGFFGGADWGQVSGGGGGFCLLSVKWTKGLGLGKEPRSCGAPSETALMRRNVLVDYSGARAGLFVPAILSLAAWAR
jgi:hypothetical protein